LFWLLKLSSFSWTAFLLGLSLSLTTLLSVTLVDPSHLGWPLSLPWLTFRCIVGLRRLRRILTSLVSSPSTWLLDAEADTLAGWGKASKRPPKAVIDGALPTIQITKLLQAYLVSVHIAHKKMEEERMASARSAAKRSTPLPEGRCGLSFDFVSSQKMP
jgi:hypothetical protein